MIALLLRLLALLPDNVLRALFRLVFSRTRRQLLAASRDPAYAQAERLQSIVAVMQKTAFGEKYQFSQIKTVDDFRRLVPLQTWDDVSPYVERMRQGEKNILTDESAGEVFFYAQTSGTTGKQKLIPATASFLQECRITNRILYSTMLTSMPSIIRGKRLSMKSPHLVKVGNNRFAGSITLPLSGALGVVATQEAAQAAIGDTLFADAIADAMQGDGAENESGFLDAIPPLVYRAADFSLRYYLCVRFALQQKITVASAINPSTLLLFAKMLNVHSDWYIDGLTHGTLGLPAAELARLGDKDRQLVSTLEKYATKHPDVAELIRISQKSHTDGQARFVDVFPHLAGLVCWKGGSAPWYLPKLKEQFGDLPILDYGYAASEGCFGAPLSTNDAASVLAPHGHFFEFIEYQGDDAEPTPNTTSNATSNTTSKPTLLLHELQLHKKYLVIITTGAGLCRYQMNDVVQVVGFYEKAPLVVFLHKGGAMSSITGEKLSENHIVAAVEKTLEILKKENPNFINAHLSTLQGFAAAPLLPAKLTSQSQDAPPSYLLAIDVGMQDHKADILNQMALTFAPAFDRALQDANIEYAAKRESLRLGPVEVTLLPAGSWQAHRAKRVAAGAPDAHVKIPHLSSDGRLLVDLGLATSDPQRAALLPCRLLDNQN